MKQRDHLGDLGVDCKIILKWIKKWDEGHGLDWSGSGLGQVASCCKGSNELPLHAANFLNIWGPLGFSRRALLEGISWLVSKLDSHNGDRQWGFVMRSMTNQRYTVWRNFWRPCCANCSGSVCMLANKKIVLHLLIPLARCLALL